MATILYTSLAEIKSFYPCSSGWKNILKGQGKKEADDTLFPLVNCLESNSINDVCWLLGKREKEIDIAVKFAKKCADSVSHIKNVDASYATYAASNAAAAASAYAASVYAASAAASAYAAAASDTTYAAAASADAASAASAASAYAAADADATYAYAAAASADADADAYAAAASAAYDKQIKLNKQFLIECIKEWEESH